MKVTGGFLRRRKACENQVSVFEAEWPAGCELTEVVCLRAIELGLDIHWFAGHCLPAPALDAYREAMAPVDKAYREVMVTAYKAYREVMVTAHKANAAARATALGAAAVIAEVRHGLA